jgi:hypothetical protein
LIAPNAVDSGIEEYDVVRLAVAFDAFKLLFECDSNFIQIVNEVQYL